MPLFAVMGVDHAPHSMEKRNALRRAHRSYVLGNDQPIRLAGPLLDQDNNQCGSFYIFEAKNEDEIREWLQAEPFAKNDVYADVTIRRIEPGVNRLTPCEWPVAGATAPSKK